MIRNFLIIPFRSLLKQRHQSIISAIGLSIALCCSILILLYIRYELSYDRYHENAENIYRVLTKHSGEFSYMGKTLFVVTPGALRGALLNDIPEVERSCRCMLSQVTIEYNSSLFGERGFLYADQDLLEMFSFPVLSGNPAESLKEPFTLFITRRMALKYFGNENPYGKTLKADNQHIYTIRGILEDIPENSHFHFDFLTGFETLYRIRGGQERVERWPNFSYLTYLQLSDGTSPNDITEELDAFPGRYLPDQPMFKDMHWILQPIGKIHLGGNANFDPSNHSNTGYIYLVTSIGIFILLIACFNYMNMATARSIGRGRETGIMKVAGSSRKRIVFQLVAESILLSLSGLLVALLLVWFTLPVFAGFTERPLTYAMIFDHSMLAGISAITISMGLFAGFFPALKLSSFSPLRLIKEEFTDPGGKRKSDFLKNMLVGFQYVISIVALVSTFTVLGQLRYIKNTNQGFTKENIITILIKNPETRRSPFFLMNELKKNPGIADVSASSCLPYSISSAGIGLWEGKPDELQATVFRMGIDAHFIDFYNLDIVSGRGFSIDFRDDSLNNFIINQTAARMIGVENPLGLKFGFQQNMGNVIGIVRDFNFQSMNLKIEPLAISVMPDKEFSETQYISVKANPGDLSEIKTCIETTLKELSPGYLNPVSILDESIDRIYISERKLAYIILFSTVIALMLTCLGQYNLSFYTTEKRMKEMSIRKIFGAQTTTIISIFATEILKLILSAVLIAWPLSYLIMNKWLQHYAFRIDLSPPLFVYSLLVTVIISVAVTGYQIIRLSAVNPAAIIRHE